MVVAMVASVIGAIVRSRQVGKSASRQAGEKNVVMLSRSEASRTLSLRTTRSFASLRMTA
jgi:hypothetical protein